MSWRFENQENEIEWESPLVSADERHKFFLPFDSDESRVVTPDQILDELEEGTILKFEACCYDSLDNKVNTSEELDVREIVSKRRESGEIPEKAGTQRVADELSDLNRNISNVINTWEVNNFLRSTTSKRVLEVIEEHGPLTVGEVIDITSIKARTVQRYLIELSDTGVIELQGDHEDPSPYNSDTVVSLKS
jgi:DNA-binding transcriptional ArsR family regulator